MLIKKSLEHLNQNNMSYWEHLVFASSHGFRCIKAGLFLILHSILPGILSKTGSTLVKKLNKSFNDHLNETT